MQKMFQHIDAFADLMNRKGYDGMFLSTYGFPDKLKDNLTQHVFQCFEEKKEIGPLNLSTYTKWTDDESPYVRCDFHVHFSDAKGFEAQKMTIHYANPYGMIREKEVHLNGNYEIPERDRANRMVLQRKQGMRI
jgi:hypothetical protein